MTAPHGCVGGLRASQVWQLSAKEGVRVVLLIRFWHPDIPPNRYPDAFDSMKRNLVAHKAHGYTPIAPVRSVSIDPTLDDAHTARLEVVDQLLQEGLHPPWPATVVWMLKGAHEPFMRAFLKLLKFSRRGFEPFAVGART